MAPAAAAAALRNGRKSSEFVESSVSFARSEDEDDLESGQRCPVGNTEMFGGILHQWVEKCYMKKQSQCFPVYKTVLRSVKVRLGSESGVFDVIGNDVLELFASQLYLLSLSIIPA